MKVSNNGYYDITNILEYDANYYIIFGEKSNGKSYALKEKVLFPYFFKEDKKFVYMRRTKDEMKKEEVQRYFNDVPEKTLQGIGNKVTYHAGNIYISKVENNKTQLIKQCGYAIPLSCEQKYSSNAFNDVGIIVLEEFVSRTSYLYDEIKSHLMYAISTIARRREDVKVFLLGNSISRICPYFSYFNINLQEWKQGDIKCYNIQDENGNKVTVAAEYCKNSVQKTKSIVFGNAAKTINQGAWAAAPQQKLNYNYKNDVLCYRIIFLFEDNFNFIAEYRYNEKNSVAYWFIYPKTKRMTRKKCRIITTQLVQPNVLTTNLIVPVTDFERKIMRDLYEEKMYFSSDLCGEEFIRLFNKLKRKFIL